MTHVLRRTKRNISPTEIPDEYSECVAYFKWAQLNWLVREYLIHHVNEGKRSKTQGYYLNCIGLRKGLPDYQLPIPNENWLGLWIEMKTIDQRNRKQKKEQIEWIDRLIKIGHFATFAYGWQHAAEITMDYLNNKF